MHSSSNPLPSLQPSNLYSFYPYSLSHPLASSSSRRPKTSSIRGEAPLTPSTSQNPQQSPELFSSPLTSPRRHEETQSPSLTTYYQFDPKSREYEAGGSSLKARDRERQEYRQSASRARNRAENRALTGLRPAGLALGRESEELDVEEIAMDDERQNINMFGHRFLLPFGRRLTQMEMEAAPSPTPSEADHERRQEDRSVVSAISPAIPTLPIVGERGDIEEDGIIDLDASIEDLDASIEDLDASREVGDDGLMEEEDEMEED